MSSGANVHGPGRTGDRRRRQARRRAAHRAAALLAGAGWLAACVAAGASETPASPSVGAARPDRRAPPSGQAPPAWRWRRVTVSASGQGQGVAAVAVEPGGGRVAVGDAAGVALREPGGRFRFAARVAAVSDLAFDPDGALWIASASGLWRLSREGRLEDRSPAPGEAARLVRRVRVTGDGVVVATGAGAWASRDGRTWTRLADGLPAGPVAAVAPDDASGGEGIGLFVLVGRELWRVRLGGASPGPTVRSARRIDLPGAPTSELPVDLVARAAGAEVVVLYPRALAVRAPDGRVRVLRPVLPPGAAATRLGVGGGRLWLATDQGLLHAAGWPGPWRRSESPAGHAAVLALAASGAGDGLLAASPTGLLWGAPVLLAGEAASPSPRATGAPAADDPDIRAVQAASLRYLDLEPERMRALAAGLAVRGWLPSLSLRLAGARDRSWGWDDDQSFVSGETRFLQDRDRDRSLDLEASIVMSWELGDLAFDDDAIDVSREHRLVVSLRDNVLDEINQLYFERRGLLERLRSDPPPPEPERRRMQLRAAELAAGLDAWTGGWFSSAAAPSGEAGPRAGLQPSLYPSNGVRRERSR